MPNQINSIESFIKLVKEMRDVQTRCYKWKSQKDFTRAKQLEGLVDVWIEHHREEMKKLEEWKKGKASVSNDSTNEVLFNL